MTSSVPSTPRTNRNQTNFGTPRRLCNRNSIQNETELLRIDSAKKRSGNEISDLLTVAVRVRPMNGRELNCSTVYDTITINESDVNVWVVPPGSVHTGLNHTFQYDHIFGAKDGQKVVFEKLAKPMLENVFKGYNSCLFAYGQTGSGKSYSMMGENCFPNDETAAAGIIPRFCYELFERVYKLPSTSTTTIEISYFEIYNEKIYDLLAITSSTCTPDRRTPLKVREHPVLGPYVHNLSLHEVKSFEEIQHLLLLGNRYRATAATVINEKSSRSHSIVSIELSVCELENEEGSSRRSKINLVDLAGSERVGSNNTNDDRHREGVSINQSLLTLGKVISALADKRTNNFIPYREATLTWLLKESLGGNSLTSMLATITPASTHIDETLSTLRYACQARSIINRAHVNENPNDRLIRELRAEVERLRAIREELERKTPTPIQTEESELSELRERLIDLEQRLEEARETKQSQMQELIETKRREEDLESRVRVMTLANDYEFKISPYKSNFLQELENLLTADNDNDNKEELLHVECLSKSPRSTVQKNWRQICNGITALKQIVDDNEQLQNPYKELNKALNSFEKALNNLKHLNKNKKSVKFQI